MKGLLSILICTVMLTACSDSNGINQQAAETTNKQHTAGGLAELKPENIAGYDEKVDIHTIGMALEKAGVAQGQQKESEWNRRLAAAKNDADFKAVLNEQLHFYRQATDALSGLKMNSEKGRRIHEHLSGGFGGVTGMLETLQTIDLTSPEGMVTANAAKSQMQQYALDIAQGMQMWIDMMKENNYDIDKAAEAEFREKMQAVEKNVEIK